jgi:meiosis-specific APC/C activator protein AMA1
MTGFEQPNRRQPIRSDRFIPTNSSFASFHVPEDFVLKSASPTKNDNNSFNADHEIAIGLVLGFKSLRKVLSFNSFAKQLSKRAIKDEGSGFGNKSYDSLSSPIHDPYVLSSSNKSLPLDDVVLQRPKKKKMIPICQSYSSLNAPGLRKDFYCNLISWSEKSNHVAVGLGLDVHVWGGSKATELLPLPEDLGAITCVTFSKDGVLAVGRKDGSIICYDVVTEKKLLARYVHLEAAVCCLAWLPNCSEKLFVGDEQGSVVLLRISKREKAVAESGDEFDYVVMKKTSMKEHTQQICG